MLNNLVCFFFEHKYFLAQELTPYSRRVCCSRCSRSFAMNDDCKTIVPWDSSFHSMYEEHGIKIKYKSFEFSKT